MTKMLQGWMVVPALAAAYLLAGPPRLLVRLRQLAVAGVAMVAGSAVWPVAVSLWPADSRPYAGGSEDGSVWNLILGYNGLGRLFGEGAGGGGGAGFGGTAGLWRMFNEQVGGQAAWLRPPGGHQPGRRAVADAARAADRPPVAARRDPGRRGRGGARRRRRPPRSAAVRRGRRGRRRARADRSGRPPTA